MKIAFAEGYLAAGDPNRAQSRAARWLRAFQQILMITVFLALLLSLMGEQRSVPISSAKKKKKAEETNPSRAFPKRRPVFCDIRELSVPASLFFRQAIWDRECSASRSAVATR